jgi:glycosyltransferase involved in cell wall biosynthesis
MEIITILIPVHNEEKTVAEAVKIVLGLKKIKNIEVIIIDNGSTDRSQEIIKNFSKNYLKFISVIFYK